MAKKKPRESVIEDYLVKKAAEHHYLCYKFTTASTDGVPDRILIGKGMIFFIELKRPNEKARELQLDTMQTMALYGATSLVLDTTEKIDQLFDFIQSKQKDLKKIQNMTIKFWKEYIDTVLEKGD